MSTHCQIVGILALLTINYTVVISYLLIGKEQKGRLEIIGLAIWAATQGSCNFTFSREPPAHSPQITGRRDPTKER